MAFRAPSHEGGRGPPGGAPCPADRREGPVQRCETAQIATMPRGKLDKMCLHAQRLCLLSATTLDKYRMEPGEIGLAPEGLGYSLFSSTPVMYALRVRWFNRVIFVLLSVIAAMEGLKLADSREIGRIPSYGHYRYTALETRAGLVAETPGIQSFGLLRWGDMGGEGVSSQGIQRPCRPPSGLGEWEVDGPRMTLSVANKSASKYGMWYVTTQAQEGTQESDAVKFVLEGSDDGRTWVRVGSSMPRQSFGNVILTTDAARIPVERDARVVLVATHSFADLLCYVVVTAVSSILSILPFVWSLTGRVTLAYSFLYVYHLAVCCMNVFGCLVQLDEALSKARKEGGTDIADFAPFIDVALRTVNAHISLWIFARRQTLLEVYWYQIAFIGIFRVILYHILVFGKIQDFATFLRVNLGELIVLVFAAIMFIGRWRIVNRAWFRMQESKVLFDAAWRSVVSEQDADLLRLHTLVSRLQAESRSKVALQITRGVSVGSIDSARLWSRSTSGGAAKNSNGNGMGIFAATRRFFANKVAPDTNSKRLHKMQSGRIARLRRGSVVGETQISSDERGLVPSTWSYFATNVLQSDSINDLILNACKEEPVQPSPAPVHSLDQLYTQAFLVQDIFLDWVVSLAAQNNGSFKLRQPKDGYQGQDQFAAWDGTKAARGGFLLGGVKSVRSSVHKLDTAYGRDVDRLLDMVRETIFFSNVEDLQKCLHSASKCKNVEIVKVKSTMAVNSADGGIRRGDWSDTGMRFVSVYVRFLSSEEARSLCVDTHVCELLLMLKSFGRLQTQQAMETYRDWRRCNLALKAMWGSSRRLARYLHSGASSADNVEAVYSTDTTNASADAQPMNNRLNFASTESSERASGTDGEGVFGVRNPTLNVGFSGSPIDGRGGKTSWGLGMSTQMVELLEALCKMSSLGLSDFLDARWEEVKDTNVDNSSLGSVFWTSKPISAILQRWPFRVWLLSMSAYVMYGSVEAAMSYLSFASSYASGPYRYYRLETMLTRDGSVGADILGPAVSDFGVIGKSGCHPNTSFAPSGVESIEPTFSGPVGSSFVVRYSEARSMNGWYLETGAGPVAKDPAFFSVWATNDEPDLGDATCALERVEGSWRGVGNNEEWCGAIWDRVGTPKWRFVFDAGFRGPRHGEIVWVQLPVTLPLARNELETFVLHPPWHLFGWYYVLPGFVWSVGIILCVLATMLRNSVDIGIAPYKIMGIGFIATLFCILMGGGVAFVFGVDHHGIECFVRAVPWTIFTASIFRQGPRWIYVMLVYAVIDIATWEGLVYWYHGDFLASAPSQTGMMALVVTTIVFLMRTWELRESRRLIQEDRERYDALWESQCAQEDSRACIEHLAKVVEMIGLWETDYCSQHNRMRADGLSAPLRSKFLTQAANSAPTNPLFWDLGHWYVPGRQNMTSRVTSMGQLYYTASIANLILIERLKSWAYRSQGFFHVEGDKMNFVKWRNIWDEKVAVKKVLWPGLKRHSRAMEKLLRSYNNDTSRLLDISRNLIVFDNMSDLTMALGIIVTDENVRVERLKNRLSYKYDAEETGGYRDVCINLRMINKEAFALGAELHMCEVQLILREFANLRSSEGHRRYVRARNLGGS